MRIEFSPQLSTLAAPALSVAGEAITVNGEPFDLSGVVPDGSFLPASAFSTPYLQGARREAGALVVTVLLPHGLDATEAQMFPEAVTISSGSVALP